MLELTIPFYISYIAIWLLVVVQSTILLGVVRIIYQIQNGDITLSKSALMEGDKAPQFYALDMLGEPVSTEAYDNLLGLLFVSPDCQACNSALEFDLEYLKNKVQGDLVVICNANPAECGHIANKYHLDIPIVPDEDGKISRLYKILAVPTAVIVNADKRIVSYGQPGEISAGEIVADEAETPVPETI